jgi:hypothetical protein
MASGATVEPKIWGKTTHTAGLKFEFSFPIDVSAQSTDRIISSNLVLPNSHRAHVVVHPRGSTAKNADLGVFLELEGTGKKQKKDAANLFLDLQIHVINAADRKAARGEIAGRNWNNPHPIHGPAANLADSRLRFGSARLVSRDALLRDPARYAPDGIMTIRVALTMNKSVADALTGAGGAKFDNFGERMYARLCGAYENVCYDVTFAPFGAARQTEVIGAHKLVIAAVSPVLAGVFRTAELRGIATTTAMQVTCPQGVAEQAIRMFVKFAYLGGVIDESFHRTPSIMMQLFKMADVFAFDALCAACEPTIVRTLAVDTCSDVAIDARKSGCKRIEAMALRFLCDHANAVLALPGAMDKFASDPELALLVLRHIAHRAEKKRPHAAIRDVMGAAAADGEDDDESDDEEGAGEEGEGDDDDDDGESDDE